MDTANNILTKGTQDHICLQTVGNGVGWVSHQGCCSCRDLTQRFSSNSGKQLLVAYYNQ